MKYDSEKLEKALNEVKEEMSKQKLGEKMKLRTRNALKKAMTQLYENPYIHFEDKELLILSDPKENESEGKIYQCSESYCRQIKPELKLCHAFWEGWPCYHRSIYRILDKYHSAFR